MLMGSRVLTQTANTMMPRFALVDQTHPDLDCPTDWSDPDDGGSTDGARSSRLLADDLREAAAGMDFELRYQPLIDLCSHRVTGFEALLRWNHAERGEVAPAAFIPVAEEIGLIDEIGKWVLEQACREAAGWPDDIYVAVNVSSIQIESGALPASVGSALAASGLAASRLELELTETQLLQACDTASTTLQELRATGVRIAIDDFGAGYSSIRYLLCNSFDKIKIDQSFVIGLGQPGGRGAAARAIVRAVIGLCASLGMICTAEGVESEADLAELKRENCAEAQGYLFSEAVRPARIPSLLRARNGRAASIAPNLGQMSLAGVSFLQIAETASDVIIVTTPDLEPPGPSIIYVNPAFTRLTGYTAAEAIGRSPRMLQGPGTDRATLDAIDAALRAGHSAHEKVLNFAKSGAPYWLDMRIVALRDAKGAITHFAAIERDVTSDKRRLDELEFAADRDTLTGIANRNALLRVTSAEIKAAEAGHAEAGSVPGPCVAFIDVDHFKAVNDELGHSTGDAILLGIAARLTENVRRSDAVGRIGGEEFAVCMPAIRLREAKAIAEHLCRSVAETPFKTRQGLVSVTVSIGVASFAPGDSLTTLMERADAALYAAKRAGRDRVHSTLSQVVEPAR